MYCSGLIEFEQGDAGDVVRVELGEVENVEATGRVTGEHVRALLTGEAVEQCVQIGGDSRGAVLR